MYKTHPLFGSQNWDKNVRLVHGWIRSEQIRGVQGPCHNSYPAPPTPKKYLRFPVKLKIPCFAHPMLRIQGACNNPHHALRKQRRFYRRFYIVRLHMDLFAGSDPDPAPSLLAAKPLDPRTADDISACCSLSRGR